MTTIAPQGSGAWLNSRVGKLTASRMADAMDFLVSGKDSKKRSDLKRELLAERLTGSAMPHFVNDAMKWGIDNERAAKNYYSEVTGNLTQDCGFYDHPEIALCGASPDALIGKDGLAEFKCPASTTHLDYLMADEVPDKYKPQMVLQMLCTGRKWCDFVSFDPRFKPAQRLFVKRYVPTDDELKAVTKSAADFLDEVDAMFIKLTHKEAADLAAVGASTAAGGVF